MEIIELDVLFENVNHVIQFRARFEDAIVDIDDNEFGSETLRRDYMLIKLNAKCTY